MSGTLREIGSNAFHKCPRLTVVWVEGDCTACVEKRVEDSVVALSTQITVGDMLLRDLRGQTNIRIPEGVRKIEDRWFMNSAVETIVIPASVLEIGKEAFRGCAKLKRVEFAEGSLLETLDDGCFRESGLEEVRMPQSLRQIGNQAFQDCKHIK